MKGRETEPETQRRGEREREVLIIPFPWSLPKHPQSQSCVRLMPGARTPTGLSHGWQDPSL